MAITIKKYGLFCHAMQFAFIAASIILIMGCSADNNISELNTYLRKSISWNCTTFEKKVPLNIYFIKESTDSASAPVIVYVKNHGGERIGDESDLSILRDYIEQRYIAITIDFAKDPRAVSPSFDKDLHEIFRAIYGQGSTPLLSDIGLEPTKYRCFFLPAGYRVATDLVFWEIDKHGSFGTMKRIMLTYNEEIVEGRKKVAGKVLVSAPEEMTDLNGKPLDYKLRMDIIYPSEAKKPVPLVFNISTQPSREPYSKPKGYRAHFTGFPMRGYAYAVIDHCYNPVRRHYWYFGRYSLDGWNGLKSYTAAIRYIRAHAKKYNINTEYIGGWGHSKGSYAITRLSDPNHINAQEHLKFKQEPDGSPEPQPWPGYSSRISAGYQSMGNGTRRTQYVTEDYVPTVIACGELDQYNHWAVWPDLVAAYEAVDANYVALGMLGMGHELPYGYDDELGIDRYQVVMDFFDRYLKVDENLPPVVLIMTPPHQKENVSPAASISIHFAPVMDINSVTDGQGVQIIRQRDGTPVEGNWQTLRRGTKFIFTPHEKFQVNESYKVLVTTRVKNIAGTNLAGERISLFKVN